MKIFTPRRLLATGGVLLAITLVLWILPAGDYIFLPDPAHPVARALDDDGPTFDVYPVNPGGPRLRSHLPFRNDNGDPAGVLAVAHDISLQDPQRRLLILLAERASRHV